MEKPNELVEIMSAACGGIGSALYYFIFISQLFPRKIWKTKFEKQKVRINKLINFYVF